MKHIEECKLCGVRHERGPRENSTLFKSREVTACTACGGEGARREVESITWLCDVCEQPIGDHDDFSWQDRAVNLRFKTLGGEGDVWVHPACVPAAAGALVGTFKVHIEDTQERSSRPASWWEKFWGKS